MGRSLMLTLIGLGGAVGLGLLSLRVLIVLILMVLAVLISVLIERGVNDFSANVVFHKCCTNIHWVFLSSYVFSYDPALGLSIALWIFAVIIFSMVLYIFASINTHKILQDQRPGFVATKREYANFSLALAGLILALITFAVIGRAPSVPNQQEQRPASANKP